MCLWVGRVDNGGEALAWFVVAAEEGGEVGGGGLVDAIEGVGEEVKGLVAEAGDGELACPVGGVFELGVPEAFEAEFGGAEFGGLGTLAREGVEFGADAVYERCGFCGVGGGGDLEAA